MQLGRGNGKSLKFEHIKIDPSSLNDAVREYYFRSLMSDLRICSTPRNCSGCMRGFMENGCDMLESDAADAIEFLLKVLEEKKNDHNASNL